jgi:abl interactor 2
MARQSSINSLQSVKRLGDVDMSSGKGFYTSVRNGTVNKGRTPPPVAPPVPSAFAPRKNTWGPPPKRGASEDDQAAPPPPPLPGRKISVPEPEPEPEPEPKGEWAESLYDYESPEAGDLPVSEGDRVLVVDRTSDDWWTAELDGRRGLVPASYLKLL